MSEAEESQGHTMVAMVIVPSQEIGPSEAIVKAFRRRRDAEDAIGEASLEQDILIFDVGGAQATVAKMGVPIPWSDLEGPCQTSWWWETACEDLEAHPNHFVIAVLGAAEDPVDTVLRLTDLVAAVLETAPALGVYWGSGTLVTQKDLFLETVQDMGTGTLPTMLWVDVRLVPNTDGTWTLFTTGMSQFGLMEIESDVAKGDGQELWNFVHDLSAYLVVEGPVIEDGHTVGPNAKTRIKVRFGSSMFAERDSQVYRLEFE